jgi:pSer/pThr/pTyr-binding forkhead associated (FHA) protein
MAETTPAKKSISPDWLVQGVLTKIGDIFDRLTGRGWKPSSSLATSELVERLKALLDAEAENTDGRGFFVPHNVQLKMQWDKFSTDSDESLRKLENELLTAAVDHINDRRYYTYQPLSIEVKPDYFTSGVKLFVSFEKIVDEDDASAINVIVPGTKTAAATGANESKPILASEKYILRFKENAKSKEQVIDFVQEVRMGVGRTKENDISIDDASISKLHASLVLNAGSRLLVADTGSTNGTFINGRRIAYGKAELINEGDKVNFGTVEVTFQHIPKLPIEETVSPTQADTVSINGLEFTSKISAPAETPVSPSPSLDKTVDSLDVLAGNSGDVPLRKMIASNEVAISALETSTDKPAASSKDLTFTESAPKPTQDRIELDFSEQKEEEAEK